MTAWPGLPRADHATHSPAKTGKATALVEAGDHVQEVLYDDATQTPTAPHVHSGDDSSLIVMPDVPNLVTDSHPQSTTAHNDVNGWKRTLVGVNSFGLAFGDTGAYATHLLGDSGLKTQFAGCDLAIAIMLRTERWMTDLTMKFGITDGHANTFAAGAMATLDETQVHVGGYRRAHTIIRGFDSTAFSADVRIGIATTGTFLPAGTEVNVTAVVVKPCSILPAWEPGFYTARQHDWELIGTGGIPLWDEQICFRDSQYLAPA